MKERLDCGFSDFGSQLSHRFFIERQFRCLSFHIRVGAQPSFIRQLKLPPAWEVWVRSRCPQSVPVERSIEAPNNSARRERMLGPERPGDWQQRRAGVGPLCPATAPRFRSWKPWRTWNHAGRDPRVSWAPSSFGTRGSGPAGRHLVPVPSSRGGPPRDLGPWAARLLQETRG